MEEISNKPEKQISSDNSEEVLREAFTKEKLHR